MNRPIGKSPTKVFHSIFDCIEKGHTMLVHSGGTSSGKTYSIVQALFTLASYNKLTITITGQDRPNLMVGPYRDAQEIVANDPFLQKRITDLNKARMTYTFITGAIIEFDSRSDQQDAKQGKRDILFANEANGISYEVFEEMNMRTSLLSIIDFNPTAQFWAHEKLLINPDTIWINTTFLDNPFIKDSVRQGILAYEPTPENIKRGTANTYRWKVYGLGEIGKLEGLVFPDWKITNEFPAEYKWRVFGLDFGFTNDPTALIEIRYAHGNLYFKQHIYETMLTNPDIAEKIKRLEIKDEIIADSAEPKSIQELNNMGLNVKGAVKGADSINQGIDAIKRYNLYIDSQSKQLIEEFSSYCWKKDKDGKSLNRPVDKYNHGIDALRYALSHKLLVPETVLFSFS